MAFVTIICSHYYDKKCSLNHFATLIRQDVQFYGYTSTFISVPNVVPLLQQWQRFAIYSTNPTAKLLYIPYYLYKNSMIYFD